MSRDYHDKTLHAAGLRLRQPSWQLRCTESQLGKAERNVKGWIVVYKQLVDDKMR